MTDHSSPVIHTMNTVALAAAPVSFWVHAAPIVTVIAGVAGIIWYTVLFVEKFQEWRRKWPIN